MSKKRYHVLKQFEIALEHGPLINDIYKTVIRAEYITELVEDEAKRKYYYEIIVDNLDIYNYMIKYEVFCNKQFVSNILLIVDELELSSLLKKQITWRNDLSDNPRLGRQVLLEFNKSYPVVMSPMLEKEELKEIFIGYLSYYIDVAELAMLV